MAKFLYLGPPTVVAIGSGEIHLSPGCQFDADGQVPYIKRLVAKGLARLVAPNNGAAIVGDNGTAVETADAVSATPARRERR